MASVINMNAGRDFPCCPFIGQAVRVVVLAVYEELSILNTVARSTRRRPYPTRSQLFVARR